MRLNQLLELISYESVQGSHDLIITDICYHSGRVKRGSLFVCIKGQYTDGHDYIMDAVNAGAFAVVVDENCMVNVRWECFIYTEHGKVRVHELVRNYGMAVIGVHDTRLALARISAAFYDYPAKKLKMIGITGTKGKTTTSFLIAGILKEAGYKTGMIGTIWVDNGKDIKKAGHTTPESSDLQKELAQMVKNGCVCCVMEVSSQGIKMQRVAGIFFDIGIFLNIEPDHIGPGEHASFAEYLYCKSRLLRQCASGIVNLDDRNTEKILFGHTCKTETFSVQKENHMEVLGQKADIVAEKITFSMKEGRLYSHFFTDGNEEFLLQMPGIFNVSNALAAILVVRHFKIAQNVIKDALQRQTVPGRCENAKISDEFVFLIDYAHNEMSLRNLLQTLREFKPGRLIVIFGCGGNRSKLRRGRMGETAGMLADFTILTSDNPRWEDPELILDDIENGMKGTEGAYIRIADRRLAVAYAFDHAREGDIIVLAGKGHEDYQEICGVRYPMEDKELIKKAAERDRQRERHSN